jgi:hypothetical protein
VLVQRVQLNVRRFGWSIKNSPSPNCSKSISVIFEQCKQCTTIQMQFAIATAIGIGLKGCSYSLSRSLPACWLRLTLFQLQRARLKFFLFHIDQGGKSCGREQVGNGFWDYSGTLLSEVVHKGKIFMVCSRLTAASEVCKPLQINGSGHSAAW